MRFEGGKKGGETWENKALPESRSSGEIVKHCPPQKLLEQQQQKAPQVLPQGSFTLGKKWSRSQLAAFSSWGEISQVGRILEKGDKQAHSKSIRGRGV